MLQVLVSTVACNGGGNDLGKASEWTWLSFDEGYVVGVVDVSEKGSRSNGYLIEEVSVLW